MRISGFSFVRNAFLYDYPFLESIQSILPICDEFIIAVGNSEDGTLQALKALETDKIRILETTWDESLRHGGAILAHQTDIALNEVKGDWGFYLQADEVVHENDLPIIKKALETYKGDNSVEGLIFNYKHFYGSYDYVGASRRWYRNEIRVIRPGIGVKSWGDAQGFRINERKLRVRKIDASIYHYGWVKSPLRQQSKQKNFNRYWHDDDWVKKHVGDSDQYDYAGSGTLTRFHGTHPRVMIDRVKNQDWEFHYDASKIREPIRERVLDLIERRLGVRIGEYKNYRLL
jgi:Glycosyl transferase family 2